MSEWMNASRNKWMMNEYLSRHGVIVTRLSRATCWWLIDRTIEWLKHWRLIKTAVNQPINELVKQPTISQPTNQSINQSFTCWVRSVDVQEEAFLALFLQVTLHGSLSDLRKLDQSLFQTGIAKESKSLQLLHFPSLSSIYPSIVIITISITDGIIIVVIVFIVKVSMILVWPSGLRADGPMGDGKSYPAPFFNAARRRHESQLAAQQRGILDAEVSVHGVLLLVVTWQFRAAQTRGSVGGERWTEKEALVHALLGCDQSGTERRLFGKGR